MDRIKITIKTHINMNRELIEQIKNGTHCIEMPYNPTDKDFEIMQLIRDEYFPNDNSYIQNIVTRYKNISRQKEDAGRFAFWRFPIRDPYFNDMVPIPLSKFYDSQPKMVEVEKVVEWVKNNKQEITSSESGERTFDGFDYIDYEDLLKFLNTNNP